MQELHIDTAEGLKKLCDTLSSSPWLALDTEFVREKTYYPLFSLLQISNGEVAASVDPLALDDLTPLLDVLYDTRITKVFHAGRQDLEIFHNLWGKLPTPLFDTQLAATLLGLGDQVGYGNLVKEVLGVELEKGHARTDWSLRPLQPAQLRYALDDVIYLCDLYLQLKERLEQQGRDGWLKADFDYLANPTTYVIQPEDAWQKVKGRQNLKGVQMAILQTLAGWRESEAQRADKPKRWILKDEVLADLARRQPKDESQMGRIRGLEPGTIKRRGETLLKLIGEGQQIAKEQWPQENKRPPRLTPNQDAMTDLLTCCLRLLAVENSITHTALGNRKELERLVAGDRDADILHGWRGSLVGDKLLQILSGELQPVIRDGVLILQTPE
ncbi:MAG: ribonuclease D [Sedimenticola sp.]